MISKNQLKLIRALGQKKQRKALGQFLVQGEKNVLEVLDSNLEVIHLFATPDFIDDHDSLIKGHPITETNEAALTRASTLSNNHTALAIVKIPPTKRVENKGIILALDQVSDPGNLGTLIRLADWYGVQQVWLSEGCADPYNPKTVSATMGSFCRVTCQQVDLVSVLENTELPVYGAFLQGHNVHGVEFEQDLILVMGSESHGISERVAKQITRNITIPSFGHAESLNVAMATGIILDNIKRVNS
jgi:TrmH family RNA methyltransferase